MIQIDSTLAFQHDAEVGEGSLWDERENHLYWVDIHGKALHRYDPISGSNATRDVGEHVSTVVLGEDGAIYLTTRNGFARFDWETGQLTRLGDPEEGNEATRFNDGKCDPDGRFWAGTMAYDCAEGAGSLYCLEKDGSIHKKLGEVSISNGLVWSRDSRYFYFIDSLTYQVHRYDYDLESGAIVNKQVVTDFDKEAEGLPDGMAIDVEDGLWVAMFGGSSILRIDPETGERTHKVKLPTSNITSCAFGGDDLRDLYITSATVHLSDAERSAQPTAGSLFVARSPLAGCLSHRYATRL